jgi:hypothetical protein
MKIIPILFIFSLLLWYGCGKDTSQEVVATVGDEEITFTDLQISFDLEPKYMIRTPLRLARQNQLDYLVDQKYYYLAADEMGLQDEPLIRQRITYIKNTEILKALINEKYMNVFYVAPDTLRKGLFRASEKRRVQNYFSRNAEDIYRIQKQLQDKTLDADRFFDEDARDLGYISYGDLDQTIEDEVYQLDTLRISAVVKSRYGYHILRVTDIVQNEDFINLNDRMRLQRISETVNKRNADERIRESLSSVAGDQKIQINNRMVDDLLKFINQYIESSNEEPTIIAPPVSNRELVNIERSLEDIYDQPLVRFMGEEITVGAFIDRLQNMPPYHRPYLSGRNFLVKSILDMMRQDLLLAEAKREGYDTKETVVVQYEKQIKDYLGREFDLRVNSKTFQKENPAEWHIYNQAYLDVKEKYDLSIDEEMMFKDVAEPDTILTKAPVQVFLKNRYIW